MSAKSTPTGTLKLLTEGRERYKISVKSMQTGTLKLTSEVRERCKMSTKSLPRKRY